MEVSAMSYIAPHVQVKVEGEEGGEHVLHTSMDYGDLHRREATYLYRLTCSTVAMELLIVKSTHTRLTHAVYLNTYSGHILLQCI